MSKDRDLTKAEFESTMVRKLTRRLRAERETGVRSHMLTADEANYVLLGLKRVIEALDGEALPPHSLARSGEGAASGAEDFLGKPSDGMA